MKELSAKELQEQIIGELGLDNKNLNLNSREVVACSIRRASSFLCPCIKSTLIHAVIDPLIGLIDDLEVHKNLVEDMLEAIISHGDLLELPTFYDKNYLEKNILLFSANPSFVRLTSGTLILLGNTPDNVSPYSNELGHQILYKNHVRLLPVGDDNSVEEQLIDHGFFEISVDSWTSCPEIESSDAYIRHYKSILSKASLVNEISGLTILDYSLPVQFYPKRWVHPKQQTGSFIARRPQAYGADLWCYIRLDHGQPIKIIDLPLPNDKSRGCDVAWHLQLAIDSNKRNPQLFEIDIGTNGKKSIDIFSPIPSWARRRWNAIGDQVVKSGCLMSFEFSENEIDDEIEFAMTNLWLTRKDTSKF